MMRCRAASVPTADALLALYVQLLCGLCSSACLARISCIQRVTVGWSDAGAPGRQMSSMVKGVSALGSPGGSSQAGGRLSRAKRTLNKQLQDPSSAAPHRHGRTWGAVRHGGVRRWRAVEGEVQQWAYRRKIYGTSRTSRTHAVQGTHAALQEGWGPSVQHAKEACACLGA